MNAVDRGNRTKEMGKQMQQTSARVLRKAFCLAVLSVVSAAVAMDFEKIALVDSLDFATFCDPETSTSPRRPPTTELGR